eukprot:Partr_v1_DN26737_c1_g1_i5_m8683 putative Calcium and integrin binding family member
MSIILFPLYKKTVKNIQMGASHSILSRDDILKYEAATFFTKPEIIEVLNMFQKLTASKPGSNPLKKHMTRDEFQEIPQLKGNPFKARLASVFSNTEQKIGFEEFLDFLSVFSEEATRDVKAFYAFKIYDWDEDGYIDEIDCEKTIKCLVGKELTAAEIKTAAKKVFDESDMDGEGRLSFVEFEHIISRSMDFENTFHIRI